jgi:DNA-binding NarL/FixJ family response regulator
MKIKILVVDDHFVARIGISKILKDNIKDLEVFTAINFIETISFLQENRVDLIILDIKSTSGASRNIIKDIRVIQGNVKILIFYSYDEIYDFLNIISGANGYLNKLSDKETIVNAINSILTKGYYSTGQNY